MSISVRLGRFAQKSLRDKIAAVSANLSISTWQHQRRRRTAGLTYARAEGIDFHSGLGDLASLLYGLVRSMKPTTCVEIGSARGKSACYVGMALKENGRGKLYAIDPHITTTWNDDHSVQSLGILQFNISKLGLTDQITIVRSTSEDAAKIWDLPIDLIFIDGDHSYEGVKRDWQLFVPHMKPFGVVVFHDTIWDIVPTERSRADMGVPRFVDELRQQHFPVITISRDCGVSMVQPPAGGQPLR